MSRESKLMKAIAALTYLASWPQHIQDIHLLGFFGLCTPETFIRLISCWCSSA